MDKLKAKVGTTLFFSEEQIFGDEMDPLECLKFLQEVLRQENIVVISPKHSLASFKEGLDFGPFRFEEDVREAYFDACNLGLTSTEYRLLKLFCDEEGKVLKREEVLNRLFDGTMVSERTLDVHICSLRRKLKPYGSPIVTLRGIGYQFKMEGLCAGTAT